MSLIEFTIQQIDTRCGEMWAISNFIHLNNVLRQYPVHAIRLSMCHMSGRQLSIVTITAVFMWNVLKLSPTTGLINHFLIIFRRTYTRCWSAVKSNTRNRSVRDFDILHCRCLSSLNWWPCGSMKTGHALARARVSCLG